MLKRAMVRQVERLLARGLSQRRVARVLGISRTTVQTIAQGRHPTQQGKGQSNGAIENEPADCGLEGELGRCPGCGRRVFLPCLACQVESAKTRRLLHDLGREIRLGLELKPEDHRRYLWVRAAREARQRRWGNRAE